jgi:hypothetical protein
VKKFNLTILSDHGHPDNLPVAVARVTIDIEEGDIGGASMTVSASNLAAKPQLRALLDVLTSAAEAGNLGAAATAPSEDEEEGEG